MKKEDYKGLKIWTEVDWFLLFLILINFGVSLYFWSKLPQIVPTHWNIIGEVDGWGPKELNLFLLPVINLAVFFLMIFFPKIDPLRKNYQKFIREYTGLRALFVIFFTFLYSAILYSSFNPSSGVFRFVFPVGFGLFFIYIGSIMPHFKTNWFAGIRTPWTLSSEKSWRETHKLAGKLFIVAGSIAIIGSVFFSKFVFPAFIIAIVLASIMPIIYSYSVWKEGKGK